MVSFVMKFADIKHETSEENLSCSFKIVHIFVKSHVSK